MKLLSAFAKTLAVLSVLALIGIVWNWAPDRSVDELSARWTGPASRFVAVEGMRVHVMDEGPRDDPQPIVLLHGTSASLQTWNGWAQALKAKRRVIRLDLPGFGLTGPAPDNRYTLDRYVRFMGAFLDAKGIKHCVLVGNSFGGEVAWMTALAQAQRVDKLVLVDSAGYPYQAASTPLGFKLARISFLRLLVEHVLPRRVIESSVRNVYGDPSKVNAELVDRYFELTLRAGNRTALIERFRQVPRGEHAELISQIHQPTLILWGAKDRLIPLENGQHFKQDIAGSQLQVFDALGHVPHEEDPARTVAALKAFISVQ
jgi:pimeloyl-ACP methyl ester carboxylesterase